ncbi:hypothetical protein ACFLZ9_00725 [Patescibacteria group bacterium]
MIDATKKCPYCAEEIKAEAVVCRFCNRDLTDINLSKRVVVERTAKKFKKHVVIAIVLLLLGVYLFISGFSDMGTDDSGGGAIKVLFGFLLFLIGLVWGLVNRIRMWWDRG